MATVTDVTSYLNALQPPGKTTPSKDLDKDDFLKLFLTQLSHQDPLNPMEDKETLAQLAQFSSLEQLANLNSQMTNIAEALTAQQFQNASNYIGKSVLASGNQVVLEKGKTTDITYAIADDASAVTANIKDKDGNIVDTVKIGPKDAGQYEFSWNGRGYNGATMSDGTYTVEFTATDENGGAVLTSTQVAGKVESVSMSKGGVVLELEDGRTVALNNVYTITNADKTSKPDDKADNGDKGNTGDQGKTGGTDDNKESKAA